MFCYISFAFGRQKCENYIPVLYSVTIIKHGLRVSFLHLPSQQKGLPLPSQ